MGYSLYDTIVVYDKVREVVGRVSATGRYTYTEMMNLSLNQVLMRSVNTSITSMIPVVSMLVIGSFVLGAVTLQEFAIALLVGILVGTYSSFVRSSRGGGQDEGTASPPTLRSPRGFVCAAAGESSATTRIVAADDAVLGEAAAAKRSAEARRAGSAPRAAAGSAPGAIPPRPRKKKKR